MQLIRSNPATPARVRPEVHLTPPDGWMNDPNGLVVEGARLHVFYQYEPEAPRWGRMRWGHAVTSDMLTWEHLPVALEPDPTGPDSFGCWSGSLVRDGAGVPTILYTGVTLRDDLRHASICLATGDAELRSWQKAPEPVIDGAPIGIAPDMFRDPFVWRRDDGWSMLVGAGTTGSKGVVLVYRSNDLRDWHGGGPFLTTEDLLAACPDLDVAEIDSACWECPQLVNLADGRSILILSIMDRSPVVRPNHVVAVVGAIEAGTFRPHRAQRLGLGPDFYAPAATTLPDGRALLFGWVPEDPPLQGEARTWAGSLTLPRVVGLDDAGNVTMRIVDEAATIGSPAAEWHGVEVGDAGWAIVVPGHGQLDIDLEPGDSAGIRIDVGVAGSLVAEIRFDPRTGLLTSTRIARVLVAGTTPQGSAELPPSSSERLRLRLILDGSVLEVVAEDRVTATIRLPSVGGPRSISLVSFGGACEVVKAALRTW
jgi:beta-fructofuranosidase